MLHRRSLQLRLEHQLESSASNAPLDCHMQRRHGRSVGRAALARMPLSQLAMPSHTAPQRLASRTLPPAVVPLRATSQSNFCHTLPSAAAGGWTQSAQSRVERAVHASGGDGKHAQSQQQLMRSMRQAPLAASSVHRQTAAPLTQLPALVGKGQHGVCKLGGVLHHKLGGDARPHTGCRAGQPGAGAWHDGSVRRMPAMWR